MRRLLDIPTRPVKRIVGSFDFYFWAACQSVGMTNLKAIGARVKSLREAHPGRFNQDDLAVAVGVSRSTIAGIEAGTDRGGIQTMIAIADYFKVPLDWLVCRIPPSGGPLVGQFVDDPDKLAWLQFWNRVPDEDRDALFRTLQIVRPGRNAA